MSSKSKTSLTPSLTEKDGESRRRFLATCGRLSIATPPAVALLLASAERNYAAAQSGGSSDLWNRVPGGGAGGGGRGIRLFGVRIRF
jgi:hypothetical protein